MKGPLFGKRQIFQVASDGGGARGRQFVMNDVDSPQRSGVPGHPVATTLRFVVLVACFGCTHAVSPGRRTFPSIPFQGPAAADRSPSPSPPPKEDPILIFRVYFVENIVGSSIETARARKMSLVYYTSDNSLTLLERHEDNSGLEQGVFLSRQVCGFVVKLAGMLGRPAWFVCRLHSNCAKPTAPCTSQQISPLVPTSPYVVVTLLLLIAMTSPVRTLPRHLVSRCRLEARIRPRTRLHPPHAHTTGAGPPKCTPTQASKKTQH
jgi:hypothetical protein